MCGIVGYIGDKQTAGLLLRGLKRLEYRGYDSAGIAIGGESGIEFVKKAGKISMLEEAMPEKMAGNYGIAHTRWATHGEPTEINAHPHFDCGGSLCVVHNGIIENYESLRKVLKEKGHTFESETDTETLAHLIEENQNGSLIEAVRRALQLVVGTFGIAVISSDHPEIIITARRGSPIVIGKGADENFVASDSTPLIEYTKDMIYLEDNEIAEIKKDSIRIFDLDKHEKNKKITKVLWELDAIEKGGYEHFLIKEIFEQPEAIKNALRGRLDDKTGDTHLGGLNISDAALRKVDSIILTGMGTALNAAQVGEYMLENIAGIGTEAENAAEFRYKNPVVRKNTLGVILSQSGETADTLAALTELKQRGAKTLGIVNVVGSTAAREVDGGIYQHAGPEISVASTKAFTSQLSVLALLTLHLARLRNMPAIEGKRLVKELEEIPEKLKLVLATSMRIKEIAKKYARFENFLYLGRNYQYPVALEGALKLKEISYIHAEGYSAAEMKHGPIALIDENFPCVFIAPKDGVYEKTISNMMEIKARKGPILAIATKGDNKIQEIADDVIYVPESADWLLPIVTSAPLQLLAYYIALERGTNVDQPRNLAKSVTVE